MEEYVKCYKLNFVCNDRNCRYWEEMTPKGREKYGNCVIRMALEGPHTLGEIAEVLGVTKERVRQLEAQALRKLAFQAVKRGLSEDMRSFVEEYLGGVVRWPPGTHSTLSGKKHEEDEMAYIKVGDDLFIEFVRDAYKEELSKKIACARASCMVNLASCLLCRFRHECVFVPERWRNVEDVSEYFVENISSIDTLIEACRSGRSSRASKAQRIQEIYRAHPDWPIKKIAKEAKVSFVYARKVLKEIKKKEGGDGADRDA
ncbi:hypothetical protein DRO31_04375 [Candidatus Bathyarchaeota archaeon]|nr:MAG: hypothetical protein DRO31_04375 [Candidatus Bathyarchaeota archaeon]